jgi:hypothetical protein
VYNIKSWLKQQGVLPRKADASFVAATEDVLEVYGQPYHPEWPRVCYDQGGKRLIGHVRPPLLPAVLVPERIHQRTLGQHFRALRLQPLR